MGKITQTPPDIQDTRTRLIAVIQSGLSQAKAAKEISISTASLSLFIKDTYTGDNAMLAKKIEMWLESKNKQKSATCGLPKSPSYVPTPTAERIVATLTYAQAAQDLVIIYGGAGVGKTSAVAHYAICNNNVWVIESTPTRNTGGALLRAIAFATNVRIPRGHSDYLENALLDRLKGTEGILIIDEAQFLNDRALENARRIAELAGIGLAFVGNEAVYGQLTGKRRAADYAQLFSRIGKRVRLNRPLAEDVKSIAKEWRLGKEELALAQDIASKPGALRGLNKTLRLATMFANGETLQTSHMNAAWIDLSGE